MSERNSWMDDGTGMSRPAMAKREDKMAWPHNKLAEVAEVVAEAIADTLGADFYMEGKEWIDEDGLAHTIRQGGVEKMLGVKFTLSISGADIEKAFYIGKPVER